MERRSYKVKGSSGLSLRVIEWGPATGEPVIMLHGIRGYAETFAPLAASLNPDFRTIAYDQRGRGESEWDPALQYYNDSYVRDLEAVVATLDLNRFDLLGHSMGGGAVLTYAAQNPGKVRRLIVEDAGPAAFESSTGGTRILNEFSTTPLTFENWTAATEFMRQFRPTVTEEARQNRLKNMMRQNSNGTWTWQYDHAGIAKVRLNPDTSRIVDLWPHVEAIACPTLVVRGAQSDYLQETVLQAMTRRNSNFRARQIENAGHYVHDDQPDLFAHWVGSFLKQSDRQIRDW